MTEVNKSRAQELLGDTAPDLVRLTDDVLFGDVHAITHLAFYAGWPNAMTAIAHLKKITEE
jgi:hypothetical protein